MARFLAKRQDASRRLVNPYNVLEAFAYDATIITAFRCVYLIYEQARRTWIAASRNESRKKTEKEKEEKETRKKGQSEIVFGGDSEG